jgi:hypothetical protein
MLPQPSKQTSIYNIEIKTPKMRRLIVLLIAACALIPTANAGYGDHQHLTPEQFQAKQRAYITEKAGLTAEEADKFFPLYFELQKRKNELNGQARDWMQKGRKDDITDAEYGKILESVYDTRIAINELEKAYLDKFRKVLSNKKLYAVQLAEVRFNRELLREMQQNMSRMQKQPPRPGARPHDRK